MSGNAQTRVKKYFDQKYITSQPTKAMFYFNNDDDEEEGEESRQNTNEDDSDEGRYGWLFKSLIAASKYIHLTKNYKNCLLTLKPFYFADPFSRVKQKLVRQYSPDIKAMHPKVRYRGKLIFFSRHGESEYNVENKVGGDSPLSDRGALYAKALGRYFNNLGESCKKYFILISHFSKPQFQVWYIFNTTTLQFRNRY